MSEVFDYRVNIRPGHSPINDALMAWLIPKVKERGERSYLDIGCNTGWLLETVPGGVGVDLSEYCVRACRDKNLPVISANACALPFLPGTFNLAVLSCILEQIATPEIALTQAQLVASRGIGIMPIPGSPWGRVAGWVKSVLEPKWFIDRGCSTSRLDPDRYWFAWG
jgi:SAM-dependent methyltransferase